MTTAQRREILGINSQDPLEARYALAPPLSLRDRDEEVERIVQTYRSVRRPNLSYVHASSKIFGSSAWRPYAARTMPPRKRTAPV